MMVSEPSVVHHTLNYQVFYKKLCLSSVFDRLIKTHISLRLGDGSSLGALWELLGSSLGSLWELVTVAGIHGNEVITYVIVPINVFMYQFIIRVTVEWVQI